MNAMATPDAATYDRTTVPVKGGALALGVWCSPGLGADEPAAQTVLAIHGITANHRAWSLVAAGLAASPGVRVLAPDLRGRGGSAGLPGPWGMDTHAADLAAVLDAFGGTSALVIGHSMGAFVSVALAQRWPEFIDGLLLVDGGPPLALPPGVDAQAAAAATLGPALQRLAMTFASREAYREFWREHPALGPHWSAAIADYVDYDLGGIEPELRSRCDGAAIAADANDLFANGGRADAWAALRRPATFLRAPLGLLAEPPGLYPPDALEAAMTGHPDVSVVEVADVNHYTITLGPVGAAAVVAAAGSL